MADGLLGLLGGGGNTGGMDLNQLVRPPDPLGDALAAMSERFASAGQASRLPTSTLGAIGSALGGASTAARASQTQYLDQAIKLEALKRSLRQAGIDERLAEKLAPILAGGAGPAPAVTPMPGAPRAYAPVATPAAAAPGAPPTTASPFALPNVPDYSGAFGPATPAAPAGIGGGDQGARARMQLTSLLGNPGGGLLADPGGTIDPNTGGDLLLPNQGGAGAATMLASFRPAALVEPNGRSGDGAGDAGSGLDLRGLLSLASGGGAADPFAGLLATDAPIQPGGPDTLVKSGDRPQLPVEQASMAAPSKGDPRGMIPFIRERAQAHGVDPDTAVAVARSEGLGSFYGDGGKSGTAFQLYTGGGLGNEFQKQTGLDPLDPKNEQAAIDWALANVNRTGWSPYHGAKTVGVSDRAGLPGGDGGSGRPGVQLAQYAPGGGQGGAAPQGGVPPLVGPGSGMIPGLNMTPQQVAAFNALYGLAGHTGSPLKEFLDIYYKSPEYLRQAAQELEAGKSAIATPATMAINEAQAMNTIKTQMANEGMMISPTTGQVIQIPGWAGAKADTADKLEEVKNKWATKLAETQAGFEQVPATILQPDGTMLDTTMSKVEKKRREDMQGNRPPQPGDIVGKPVETPATKFGMQKFGESYDAAQNARVSLENNNRMVKLLDEGIITGTGANTALALQKLGAALGYTGHDRVARTEQFLAAMGSEVANVIKQGKFGPPTSDTDRKFAQDVAGQNITLDEQTIRRLFALREEVNRGVIDRHNKEWAPLIPPGSGYSGKIDPPPRYGARTATGPTGQRMWDDNGTWRPM